MAMLSCRIFLNFPLIAFRVDEMKFTLGTLVAAAAAAAAPGGGIMCQKLFVIRVGVAGLRVCGCVSPL